MHMGVDRYVQLSSEFEVAIALDRAGLGIFIKFDFEFCRISAVVNIVVVWPWVETLTSLFSRSGSRPYY